MFDQVQNHSTGAAEKKNTDSTPYRDSHAFTAEQLPTLKKEIVKQSLKNLNLTFSR